MSLFFPNNYKFCAVKKYLKSNYIRKPRTQGVAATKIRDAHAQMFLPLINHFTRRITLKCYKDAGGGGGGEETVVVQKILTTQIWKRYIIYFEHKHPIKMNHKLKTATGVILYISSLYLNQLREDISRSRECERSLSVKHFLVVFF